MKGYQLNLKGKKAFDKKENQKEGNIVLGFTSSTFLMLDVDDQNEQYVQGFVKRYSKFYNLGSVLVLRSSKNDKIDLFGNRLGNYLVIFGRALDWKEIQWHASELERLGFINRAFAKLRKFDSITIRVNSKNKKIPPPEVIKFCNYGDMEGIIRYIRHKNICEGQGEFWIKT